MSEDNTENAPYNSVQITLKMLEDTDLRASIGWNFSPDIDERAMDNLRYIGQGIMFLVTNQIEELAKIGANLEAAEEAEEPIEHEGIVIPFPTHTRH
jgi:hypothetical protein